MNRCNKKKTNSNNSIKEMNRCNNKKDNNKNSNKEINRCNNKNNYNNKSNKEMNRCTFEVSTDRPEDPAQAPTQKMKTVVTVFKNSIMPNLLQLIYSTAIVDNER